VNVEDLDASYVMTIPDHIAPVRMIKAYHNGVSDVVYALGRDGLTYLIDLKSRQFVRAIAPKGLFT